MKNIAFFITHKTLGLEHARACFYGMSKQNYSGKKFEVLYLYNSHQDELSNETLLDLYSEYDLQHHFNEVVVFNYDNNTHKSLGADINTINNYLLNHYSHNDRVLVLKSDCVLSKNYFNEILNIPKDSIMLYTAPFICAKERVTDKEIFEYASRDKFIPSDDITFMVEDQTGNYNVELHKGRPDGLKVDSEQIKFTSCYVYTDFSCHFYSLALIPQMQITFESWGGVKFYSMSNYLYVTDNNFVIHKYHDIVSTNRATKREGPVESWLTS